MSRRSRAIAAVLIVGAFLVACDPSPSARTERPVPGGELVVALRDLGGLDPARATGRGAVLVIAQVFDSLTAIDPETGAVTPAAAESWRVTREGLRWTFTLRAARFHDGTPVRARDFKFAFDRIARRDTRSEAAFQLEHIRGFREANTLGTANELAGVTVRDARTLVIDLERPYSELLYALAHPGLAPLPAGIYRDSTADLATSPIGNGPFRIAEANEDRSVLLERNEAYEPTPFLERVRFVLSADVDEGWRAFQRGEVHLADVPIAQVPSMRARYENIGFTPQWSTLAFGPNLALEKYRSREVRRALSLAIDREAIADVVYGHTKDPATGILPRGIRGYVPDICRVCVRDVERARQIVEAAFGDDPPLVRIDHLTDQASRLVARALSAQLEEAGFRPRLRAHAPADYLRLLQRGGHDLAQLGWIADVPSPDGFLAQQLRTGSPNNQTGFSDRDFDRLIDAARSELNDARRLAGYRDAEARALELMPLIPVVFFRNRVAVAGGVRGLIVDGAGLFDAASVWLAP